MELLFNINIIRGYKNNSQKIRVLTEDWVLRNLFCPICANTLLDCFESNMPVADFFCNVCKAQFELKSKKSNNGKLGKKIVDGAYKTMIERITSLQNPNFFFLTYKDYSVNNFLFVPNYFFTPAIIEKRKPLSHTARRAGWTGCNINMENIPETGKIYIIKNGRETNRNEVVEKYKRIESLKIKNIEKRCWIMDILNCIERIPENHFSLQDIYLFADELQLKYPQNNFVKDKIRQQLQLLRDKGIIEFTSRGNYRKLIFF